VPASRRVAAADSDRRVMRADMDILVGFLKV
jgi:hypothetical protein